MKRVICVVAILFFGIVACPQDMKKFNLYKPEENAKTEIAKVVKEAKAGGKYVFIQIGGNWCIWCARFHDFVKTDESLDSLVKANFVVYHLNYSKENYNKEIMAKYGFPQRFGFPVFLVLDEEGKLLHTQNSAYLEEGSGYSRKKVVEFFNHWSPKALAPEQYKEQ